MFFIILIIIFLLSILLAVLSLWKELQKTHEKKADEVTKELDRGRVIFYSPSSKSPEDFK